MKISLATETEYVRSRLAAYGNDLLSLGFDGFRLDAAKRQKPGLPTSLPDHSDVMLFLQISTLQILPISYHD